MAFMFYLKVINMDITLMVTSIRGNTLPDAYEMAMHAENNLIDVGKLSPQPPILVFTKISDSYQEEANPSTPAAQLKLVSPQPMNEYPTTQASTSGLSSLAVDIIDIKDLTQTFANELVIIKRQQMKPPKMTTQVYGRGKTPYQHNSYQGSYRGGGQ